MTDEKNNDSQEKKGEIKNEEGRQEGNETIKEELELSKKKEQEYLDGWKRAKADYLNLKRESEQRYQELIKFANAGLILEILPVLDNFKLATQHIPEEQKKAEWVIGIVHIKKQLEDTLKNLGIETIKTVGEKFNPEFHEAVEKSESGKDGIITKEVRPGYILNGKVIQVAKVIVS